MRRDTAELLAAYADDAELTADEKRRVEHMMIRDPGARADEAATRALLGKLRALPSAKEPDWDALERSIRLAVPDEVKRPWWRSWRLSIPVVALAGIGALVFALTRSPAEQAAPIAKQAETPAPAPVVETTGDVAAIYLDGDDIEIPDDVDAELIEYSGLGTDELATSNSFLGDDDLAWIDELDDDELESAAGWLEHHRKGS